MQFIFAFVLTLFLVYLIAPYAIKHQLVDIPDERKQHVGTIPLIGGVVIFLSLMLSLLIWHELNRTLLCYMVACLLLVVSGAIDDRHQMTVKTRIALEIISAGIMIFGASLWVSNLGNLLGFGEIIMPFWLAFIFTQVAVFGIINAINMMDGIDGLASGVVLSTIVILFFTTSNSPTLSAISPALIGALAAFMLCNLNATKGIKKIFLGDSGAMFLGFTLVWVLIEVAVSGGSTDGLSPESALYFVALPLFDMVSVTLRRVKHGESALKSDRRHLHHLLLKTGLTSKQVLFAIITTHCLLVFFGLLLAHFNVLGYVQFLMFWLLYLTYSFCVGRLQKRLCVL